MNLQKMSGAELAKTTNEVNSTNKKFKLKDSGEKSLGKDSFLKILVTQLKHQDPTKPLEDREFISQMAQFSSLEQMTNMNKDFSKLLKASESSEANSFLGKEIDSFNSITNRRVSGKVNSVKYDETGVKLVVGKDEVSLGDVSAVRQASEAQIKTEKALPASVKLSAGKINIIQ